MTVALVTGAARRVGRAIALALAGRGYHVVIHHHGSPDLAESAVGEARRLGVDARALSADLRDPAEAPRLIAAAVEAFGGLDVLVNSAAVMRRTPFGSVTAADWDDIMGLNLRAPFLLSQAAAPHLAKRKGVIINIADLAAFETWPGYIPHGVSKAGVVQLTRALAHVLAPDVRVNAIAPGAVLLPADWSEEDARRLEGTTPLRRLGSVEDATGAVLYLVDASFVTGEVLIVDGGRHVRQ